MKTDVEILTESYEKYKDKNGKKANALRDRIEGHKAFEKLLNMASKPQLK